MKRLSTLVLVAALAGCASTGQEQAAEAPAKIATTVSSLADITYSPITVYSQAVAIERAINAASEVLDFDGETTPVAGWKLPDYGVYQFKVESLVTRKGFGTRAEAFMPEVWLLDRQLSLKVANFDEEYARIRA
ncbi:hypothetical protein [Endozoicomonas lisbonensis]|uniref:Uncharacterized protein n=1 Tax=Endozoicomonas lisbonensis TaxID=3120522 RepID=A0ABV2SK93_9GAMM